MALISQADLESKLGRSLTTAEANAFPSLNTALQSMVEKMIVSKVEAVSETSRFFDGGVQHLSIDPCTAVTGVYLVDDDQTVTSTFDTTDYTVEPINSTLKRYFRKRSGAFQTGINNLKVTAKFSIFDDTDTLNIVKDSMLEALASEIQNNDNKKKESIEGYTVEFATTETKDALSKIMYLFPQL